MPAFLHPYLARQIEDQSRRRAELADGWKDTDLVVDAGDGGAVSPVNLSSAWPGSFDASDFRMCVSTIFATGTRR